MTIQALIIFAREGGGIKMATLSNLSNFPQFPAEPELAHMGAFSLNHFGRELEPAGRATRAVTH